jgi:hypothetical protein
MLKIFCRVFGHHCESYERIEWLPSFDADPLEKVIAHCRCERCDTTWEEVIYDGDKIAAELRGVEQEITLNPFAYESCDDPQVLIRKLFS